MGMIDKSLVDSMVEAYEEQTKFLERKIEELKAEQKPENSASEAEQSNGDSAENYSRVEMFRNANILNNKGAK